MLNPLDIAVPLGCGVTSALVVSDLVGAADDVVVGPPPQAVVIKASAKTTDACSPRWSDVMR
ncbi:MULTISPECIES: hypothetical protein [unclassified Streptomyces]|uniref:hypothetical protein n=1 Tax=unclassified Streptomyces TaxID=2593676 RepID=UPI001F04D18B|nr:MULTISPECIES: hypothetical protein [unclassified Streptomyces]MCH0566275.1 hypothetical protein [Streptomyces sp. MUM 2J]MCH0572431.1 hypothetical protein [Streptomyces sp. MUM 136J]